MEDLTLVKAGLAIAAGILAGIINTLAGSGSTITLPMLVFLGVPAHEANATNRIGVALQNIAAVVTLRRSRKVAPTVADFWYTGAMMVGSIGGAAVAAEIDERITNYAITAMLVLVLATILLKPERWLRDQTEPPASGVPPWSRLLLFLAIGAYGGFIQAGVGLFILAGLILGANYTLVHANTVKLEAVLYFTLVALVVFLVLGTHFWWGIGLLMAVGQSLGAWLAARFMADFENARYWIRWLLIIVIVYSIVRFSGLQAWLVSFG